MLFFFNHFSAQGRNRPKQKENGEPGGEAAQKVDRPSDVFGATGQKRKKAARQHKERGPGGVHNLQFETGRNKFTAVPKRGCGFQGEGVNSRRKGKNQPSQEVVNFLVAHFSSI